LQVVKTHSDIDGHTYNLSGTCRLLVHVCRQSFARLCGCARSRSQRPMSPRRDTCGVSSDHGRDHLACAQGARTTQATHTHTHVTHIHTHARTHVPRALARTQARACARARPGMLSPPPRPLQFPAHAPPAVSISMATAAVAPEALAAAAAAAVRVLVLLVTSPVRLTYSTVKVLLTSA